MSVKIITVDDHEIFRKGLNMILKRIADVEVIAEASNGVELLELLEQHAPDLILIDIQMPEMDGISATQKALTKYPDLKIVAISMFGQEDNLEKMINAGARGFLLKNIGRAELEIAIQQVSMGNNYYSSELLPWFTHKFIDKKKSKDNTSLTDRELDILKLIAKGMTSKEIADQLYLSKRTVEGHKANMIAKTGSKNAIDLLVFAIKKDLVRI
jgi:DNA-binding NarL/FixJ family response regulator